MLEAAVQHTYKHTDKRSYSRKGTQTLQANVRKKLWPFVPHRNDI
jgi:hypothetical protein